MTKKKVFVVSHSHWDREWYMGYEHHHMRLVTLMDDLLELFKTEPGFNSFHLDGQTIILDDYLQVRPEREAEVRHYIEEGKLKVGPFYILQDDFLISSEANTRDILIGAQESKKWGNKVNLGYFPDTFGNMGQTAQMMKLSDLDFAAFGRGVKPTGLNNQVFENENYSSQYSEMWWKGPDGSKVLGLLFANWYSNGNEIPVDKTEAKEYWDQKLQDVEKYASTDNLLMMNGVDHQPVQKDVVEALDVASELYPDYEFIHSNFDDYLKAVAQDIPEDLSAIDGELTSQETDGWYTLANTASSRVYLKQENTKVQRQLENITEPLAAIAYKNTDNYPHDQLKYAWKTLMQNHPHDSICGCSVDEVHREMMTRFEKSREVGEYLANDALNIIASKINTSVFAVDSKPFVVVNTQGYEKSQMVSVEIEWDRAPFSEGKPNDQYELMQSRLAELPELEVVDKHGYSIPFELVKSETRFGYDLPKERFRIPYMGLFITIRIPVENLPALSWTTLALQKKSQAVIKDDHKLFDVESNTLENNWLKATVKSDGSLKILDKKTDRVYDDQMIFEDTGDIGNEYIYRQSADKKTIYSTDSQAEIEVLINNEYEAKIKVSQDMCIPVSADERLEYEQKSVIDITERTARRAKECRMIRVSTVIGITKMEDQLKFLTTFDNTCLDHRVRVLFPTKLETDTHNAESIYEVVERSNQVSDSWENPTNPQHQQAFVNVQDNRGGVTIGNLGLNEYEILPKDNTIAVTLLRSVGEMGDWGYFETKEAQCQGAQSFVYSLSFHDRSTASQINSYMQTRNNQVPLQTIQTDVHDGEWKLSHAVYKVSADDFVITCFKQAEDGTADIIRGYNMTNESEAIGLNVEDTKLHTVNLLEEPLNDISKEVLEPAEIKTFKINW
ncbi:alpha-mannosidase [Companilactobacillus nodensis]|uniref:Family 38 glycosyl hydrolase n=1 Tax=Companilactobacillus nodensis DSM 19682 = JCM 14932 = NBRC 107160 TaxID=1423775 RepID=A0A0R1KC09_9LACO|nr:alpha-mannosidase [Companilactobacillus nodensis]KRK81181.1 family 38 glycosyl hydrolase [Companilactobacillus nodensis DSM 19682 = JCM 14932 = NBRC 107160]